MSYLDDIAEYEFFLCDECSVRDYCTFESIENGDCVYDRLLCANEETGELIKISEKDFKERLKQNEVNFKRKYNK